ncbi:MAG: hypothetical protein NT142_11665 [Planctomycetota bacterium]|nr:hypothetical protein [Planctomycetota bacterium]
MVISDKATDGIGAGVAGIGSPIGLGKQAHQMATPRTVVDKAQMKNHK